MSKEASPASRTKDRALAVLKQHLGEQRQAVPDDLAQAILSDQLLTSIFDLAWRHQFVSDRSAFQSRVREKVEIAVEAHEVEGWSCD